MQARIPLPILLFTGFLLLFGLSVAYNAYFNPAAVVPGYSADTPANQMMQGMFASRVTAMVVVLALALYSREPRLLALALFMRLLTEAQDTYAVLTSGAMANAAAFAGVLGVIIVLEILCIWRLLQIGRSHGQRSLA